MFYNSNVILLYKSKVVPPLSLSTFVNTFIDLLLYNIYILMKHPCFSPQICKTQTADYEEENLLEEFVNVYFRVEQCQ